MQRGEALALQDVDGPLHDAQRETPDTRGHVACDSIYMTCPE